MDHEKKPGITLIIGKRGFGKTYLAKTLTRTTPRVIFIEQSGRPEYDGEVFTDFDGLANWCSVQPRFRAVWRGGEDKADAVFLLALAVRNVSVLLDEAGIVDCVGYFKECVYRGRSPAGVSIVALAQRPQLLRPDLRSQADEIYCFNQSEPSALTWLKPCFGSDVERLPNLAPKHGLHFSIDAEAGGGLEAFRLP